MNERESAWLAKMALDALDQAQAQLSRADEVLCGVRDPNLDVVDTVGDHYTSAPLAGREAKLPLPEPFRTAINVMECLAVAESATTTAIAFLKVANEEWDDMGSGPYNDEVRTHLVQLLKAPLELFLAGEFAASHEPAPKAIRRGIRQLGDRVRAMSKEIRDKNWNITGERP